ncbi:MAG: hypothetical protein Edafosvirus3_77 [Edafosvirus sp.]|uniref:Uncharacterized protein n=1 Tax=Edafosvirus sp. TaxID=2487765 RepID=A0A3G4ZX45_9VIRU|nr:MAG: hypothetical protein Edafosvirus3_77 [Edafosvirus sp.]
MNGYIHIGIDIMPPKNRHLRKPRKHVDARLRKKMKKHPLNKILDIRDLFNNVLEFTGEEEKINVYKLSQKIRKHIKLSKFCPVYYKLTPNFFVQNLENKMVLATYNSFPDLFSKLLTKKFLSLYCVCRQENDQYYPFHRAVCDTSICKACLIVSFYSTCYNKCLKESSCPSYTCNGSGLWGGRMESFYYVEYPRIPYSMYFQSGAYLNMYQQIAYNIDFDFDGDVISKQQTNKKKPKQYKHYKHMKKDIPYKNINKQIKYKKNFR